MRRRFPFSSFCFAVICLLPASSTAQLLINPQTRTGGQANFDLMPTVSFMETGYEIENGGDVDVERSILGVAGAYGLNPSLDLYGEIGYVLKAEPDGGDDGDGILLGGGVKGLLYQKNGLAFHGNAGIRYIDESYDSGTDGHILEIPLGATVRGKLNREVGLYGGIDVYPFSDGEIEVSGGRDTDIERDNLVGMRLGADYRLDTIMLNGEFSLISDKGFTFRLILPL